MAIINIMEKSLSDNLNLLMAKARLTSNELARQTGLPATTIKRIRNNEQSNPTIGTLLPIAKQFSISLNELLGYDLSHTPHRSSELKSLPILSWRECIHHHLIDYTKVPHKITTEKQVSEKGYCLIVEETDLQFFPEKSLLIIEPCLNAESGDFVIVAKSEQGSASIKKYLIETDHIYLKSLVQGLGITELTKEHMILGVIVQYKVDLKHI